ncbi:DUF805 domain-containing protein [Tropicimonas sp. S265A]|uniref:DUF805 domain-containing protein n=1 Tax=Tropicimonas sp. S265A TaxID=3415134 RepID=UPI003C7CFDC1
MENLSLAVRSALSNYATFSGRDSRPAYWWWALSIFLLMLGLGVLDAFVVAPLLGIDGTGENPSQPLSFLASLALILPNVAVGARRLHDIGRSGWWLLLGLIPLVGFLVLLYFFTRPSDPGDNAFGPRPHWPPQG